MNYKLINTMTTLEQICSKVEIKGFDYYLSNETIISLPINFYYVDDCNTLRQSISDLKEYWSIRTDYKKVIATDNSNIDLPQIKNEIKVLANKIAEDECRWGLDKVRAKFNFLLGYNISQKTHSNSNDDMLKFGEFCILNNVCEEESRYYQYWELLKIWKSKQTKTIYYE